MARKTTVEITCDRCDREAPFVAEVAVLQMLWNGHQYEPLDLCPGCRARFTLFMNGRAVEALDPF